MSDSSGGRIFFSNMGRSLEEEDEIRLVSVGVDIGSSTSHLVFSRIVLERLDNRYIVSERVVLHESDVLLTPYAQDQTIDAAALGAFIDRQYELAGVEPCNIDTGALILTGVAVRRSNARAIGELFASQAGKFVSVSAGDGLEATLAAYGSGAMARSIRENSRVMNIDIGGGTSKIAVCEAGELVEMTAVDVGARIVSFDGQGRVQRIEEAGRRFAQEAGLSLELGQVPDEAGLGRMVEIMADCLMEVVRQPELAESTAQLLRLDPLRNARMPDAITFSGGVSEYIYGRQAAGFGDLGARLAQAMLDRVAAWGPALHQPEQGIRATVVGASQYTIQVSGSTIYVEPLDALPLRNVPVISPDLDLAPEQLDAEGIAQAIAAALRRLDLHEGDRPVALCYRWQESAMYGRMDAFCRGVSEGLSRHLAKGQPLILVGEGDIGGLIGMHLKQVLGMKNTIASIDGIALKEFDFIDIGKMLDTSGAVPVVIKSLVFPSSAALGRVVEADSA
ncbi:ethanolamine ammonia-lyase reactivating factor EutA [Pusillimonas noertemannii]|uniref:Reactivating factor of adenosylcobalamin-dependent ethanolamine ammonia lyase n=1 Tax=Pusillimonas noertemannii TaxID=305977 RepID=A0A2U1CIG5_9BURK|nr:ethanolamine ammonia-lyase reactivating factor EutA [Pusillimonas noertemannii]NYT70369.1 ethanolamine ammonia-lyase reactivating factor EutA [Pusillimonas noertemannii]PVY60810.1 reactivating factor of adenosylcobalamin-dependent ethanolamine ammonia lyase [Pusillimonas noertemannii]TFL08583.1 ethanolamine utilization protein EutA [Pusillimonas noertemannii]